MITALALFGCAAVSGARLPGSAEEIERDFRALHAPIYRVYELPPDRDAVYDHLAASFEGEALTQEYIEHYTALVRLERTDSAVTVLGVEYDDVLAVAVGARSATVEADWTVRGQVRHGSHTHERINRYQASYTLVPTEEGPRIHRVRMKNLQRQEGLAPESGLDQQTLDRLLGPE